MMRKVFGRLWPFLLFLGILCVGVFTAPLLHRLLFNPENVVREQDSLVQQLELAQDKFESRLAYPFAGLMVTSENVFGDLDCDSPDDLNGEGSGNAARDSMSDGESLDTFLADSKMYDGGYESLFELAGVSYDSSFWSTFKIHDAFHTLTMTTKNRENTQDMQIQLALRDFVPVFFCSIHDNEAGGVFVSDDVRQERLEFLRAAVLDQTTEQAALKTYIDKLDRMYDDFPDFQTKIYTFYRNILAASSEREVFENDYNSLWECVRHGQWQIYTEGRVWSIASIMEDFTMIIFFDPVQEQFCGFNLAPNTSFF